MTEPLRRRVYFISGFDPRGVMHYHRLYRDEAEKQSRINRAHIATGRRKRAGAFHRWQIEAEWREGRASSDYHFLSWDDVIRSRWQPNWALCMAGYVRDLAGYIASGAFLKLARTGKGALYAAVAPLAIVSAPFLLALAAWIIGGWAAGLAATAIAAIAIF
jgi:hypothetical protein